MHRRTIDLVIAALAILVFAPHPAAAAEAKRARSGSGQEIVVGRAVGPIREDGARAFMRREPDGPAGEPSIELSRRGELAKRRVRRFGAGSSNKMRVQPGDAPTIMRMRPPAAAPQTESLMRYIGATNVAFGGSFTGQAEINLIPPDPTLAAGPFNLVGATNDSVRIFKKNGTPVNGGTLQNFIGATDFTFDPKALFDEYIQRFWLLAVTRNPNPPGDPGTRRTTIQVALSDTDDATGTWHMFPLNMKVNGSEDDNNWCDYPQIGIDHDHVYFTCNMFEFGGDFQFAKIRIMTKSQFVNNNCCRWWDFWDLGEGLFGSAFTVQPAHMYGTGPLNPMILVSAHGGGDDDDTLSIWRIRDADKCCGGPGSPTLEEEDYGVGSYAMPGDARQMTESIRIDAGDTRLLYAIWKLDRLATGQTTACADGHDICTAYTEIDILHGIDEDHAVTLSDFIFGSPGADYYYPRAEVNAADNRAMVYARSSTSEFAGSQVVGIPSSDVCRGCVEGPENTLLAGANTYVSKDSAGNNRWGDYFGAAADPDGLGIWIHGEAAASTFDTWQTQVGLTYENLDLTAPVSTGLVVPPPNLAGWNNSNCAVFVSMTDAQSGPRFVHSSATGANPIGDTTSTGPTTFVDVSSEGVTTVSFAGEDKWGNVESPSKTKIVMLDKTLPVSTAGVADGLWHADNVSLEASASDTGGSNLVPPSSVFVSTNVPPGTETANALTGTHLFCDTASNCVTAGPVAGNKVDRKPPAISIATPSGVPLYALNQAVPSAYLCSDGGSGLATCDGPVANGANIDTTSVGSKSFTVNASDIVANASTATENYNVSFNICLGYDPLKTHKAGAAVPIQLDVCDANGVAVSNAAIVLTAIAISPAAPLQTVGNSNPGNVFSFNSKGGYLFMLNTKTYAPGNYNLIFQASGDPVTHQAPFILK